ncbi:MAG TPA: hypothetical protein VN815_11925 [Steroidobacteraceae bacterium]|nr:hypothetical protein [Steroidobacteraceae bacterium]
MGTLNFVLEQVNAAASLLTFSLLIFLTFYLWDWLVYKGRTPWRALLIGLPPAIALAALLYLDKVGTLLTRSVVWMWRVFGEGVVPFTDAETFFLLGGSLITSIAVLLMIRLLTRPRFGDWPWMASASITCLYLAVTTLIRAWMA